MNKLTDQQLLREYAESGSEAAFAELVRRHVDLVYSAARRMVRDAHLAEDVTQGVFVALANNAAELTERPVLSGWLHRTTQNLAAKLVRSDVRRRSREQEAVLMNEMFSTESDASWEAIAPLLDTTLGELSEPDRDALLLRYFEHKSAREMAQVLGVSDEAAQKRVSRAVERVREVFSKRGVTVGAGGLVALVSANAVQAAPVALAATISAATAVVSTTVATTAAATTTKAIAMTTLQKTTIVASLAVVASGGIYEARQASHLQSEVQTLQQQQAPLAEKVEQLQQEREAAKQQLAALRQDNERLNRNTGELLRLRGEVTKLRNEKQRLIESDDSSVLQKENVGLLNENTLLMGLVDLRAQLVRMQDKQDSRLSRLHELAEQLNVRTDAVPNLIASAQLATITNQAFRPLIQAVKEYRDKDYVVGVLKAKIAQEESKLQKDAPP